MSGSSGDEIKPVAPVAPVKPIPDIAPVVPIDVIAPLDVPPPASAPAKIKNTKALPYFLKEDKNSDLMKNLGPAVEASAVTPIIDGELIFTELETQILKASQSVLIAFWSIDPEMKMVTDSSKSWGDLLIETAKRNVMVRVLWTDFDPGLQLTPHAMAWKRYFLLFKASKSIAVDLFQIVCSHHEAEIDASMMGTFFPGLYDTIVTGLNSKSEKDRELYFFFAKGLWDKVNYDRATKTVSEKTPKANYSAWPAVHHQKTVIIDSKYAYTGGVNVTSQYVDNNKHLKAVDPKTNVGPWHDAFVKVEGNFAVQQFVDNYIGLWNQERKRAELFLQNAFAKLNFKLDPADSTRATTDLTSSMFSSAASSTTAPSLPCQVHRTVSIKGTASTGVPKPIRKDILEGYLAAIQQAENYIYIENQYFREKEIGNAIINQHKIKADLRTIIVLPKIPEEFLTGSPDILSKHGVALQYEIIESMKTAVKDKLGVFSPVRKDTKQIYVHSKLMLIDDKFGSIGSANSNPRSYKTDTELDFVWYDEKLVKKLREELWNEMLGKPSGMTGWKAKDYVIKWSAVAKANKAKPSAPKGFVFPFENINSDKSLFVPDEFV